LLHLPHLARPLGRPGCLLPPARCPRPHRPQQPRRCGPLLLAQVKKCLSIKGAEDTINKPHAFEISTTDDNMFFIADGDKVRFFGWKRWARGMGDQGGRSGRDAGL
jgi:hypothetical protein